MSDLSRRDILRSAAVAALLGGGVGAEAAQHVHQAAAEAKKAAGGVYAPKALLPHEYKTVQRLAALIVPADDVSPSALEAGAPEFIDLLCSQNPELLAIYTGGIGWLDAQMNRRFRSLFIASTPAQQGQTLDLIAYKKNDGPELGPGILFFDWIRKMVVDGFYTSPLGFKDIEFLGNKGMTTFQIPKEAIAYAIKRSPEN